jgi:hypothetical protein
MLRAISRKPMPDAWAVRISAQVVFVIVRLTPKETLTQNLWGSKFDGPAVGFIDWLDAI